MKTSVAFDACIQLLRRHKRSQSMSLSRGGFSRVIILMLGVHRGDRLPKFGGRAEAGSTARALSQLPSQPALSTTIHDTPSSSQST
jgi:hypothetical protein